MVLILILLGLCYFLEKGRRRWVMKIIKMDKKIEKEQNKRTGAVLQTDQRICTKRTHP